MDNNSIMYFVHCMSSVHVGTGQGIGVIDLPMLREKITEWPYLPGSSLKGVHREYFRTRKSHLGDEWMNAAFGKAAAGSTDEGNAGALVMSDAKLLAFPVTSQYGTFAYVTCPLAIQRMQRDMAAINVEMPPLNWTDIERELQRGQCIIPQSKSRIVQDNQVVIEEFTSQTTDESSFKTWTNWLVKQLFARDTLSQTMLTERIVLVPDDAFQYFATMCCEITPRIRIHPDTGTVEDKALWMEEYLPSESLLYGLIWSDKPSFAVDENEKGKFLAEFREEIYLQIGGNATVGKGRIRCIYAGGGEQ